MNRPVVWGHYIGKNRAEFDLEAAELCKTQAEAVWFVSPWKGLRGFKTSTRRRHVRADGLEIILFVALVWKRKADQ